MAVVKGDLNPVLGVTSLGLDGAKLLAHQQVTDDMGAWATEGLAPFASPGSQRTHAEVTVVENPEPCSFKFKATQRLFEGGKEVVGTREMV